MNETQLSFDGAEVPWEEATVKAQEKNSRKTLTREKQAQTDKAILTWMKELNFPVSVDELAARLKPVGYSQGTVANSMRRLRKNRQIISDGSHDPDCELHKVLSNFRWQVSNL